MVAVVAPIVVIVVVAVVAVCAETDAFKASVDDHQYVPAPPVPAKIISEPTATVAEAGEMLIVDATTTTVEVSVSPSESVTVIVAEPVLVVAVKSPLEFMLPIEGSSVLHE